MIDGTDSLTALVGIAVDGSSNDWQLSNQVNAVLVGGVPVFGFVNALQKNSPIESSFHIGGMWQSLPTNAYLRISLSEFAVVIQSSDGC